MSNAILLVSCPDHRGITAAITNYIFQHNGNILHADQHTDDQTNTFFMRVEWDLTGFDVPREKLVESFAPIAQKFNMEWSVNYTDQKARVAIFVSRHLHCLYDLLYRRQAGHLDCEIPLIISNHQDAEGLAKQFGIKFCHFSIMPDNKSDQEKRELELLKQERIDSIVLARYHQILSPGFVEAYNNQIINIHHSFLPAFVGQNPYDQAFRKGVKIIGATSHYVTADLDQGPIIEQDTVRISHRDELADLIRKGEDLEKMVLSRAVRWHLQKKILCYGNKTVVFD
ncbi:MAG: formyltetrahydrofolate deformylase [Candidatus Omnitrophica bacterium]|nr:formyltetrahydrofolate deformylase [Candidatus Omnitrophota bacterium]